MSSQWNADQIPDQSNKTVIVTGANSGLGYETARALAAKGAHVIMANRDAQKSQEAAKKLRTETQRGQVTVLTLDLASLASIRSFAEQFRQQFNRLDLLINNAGVMHLPYRETADGFEMHIGTNHLGHFALTGLLLPLIINTPQARIVTVSSGLHRSGHINFDDLYGKTKYDEYKAYSQSKLANLLFTYELQRKLAAHNINAISVAAHPGYAATNLQLAGPRMKQSAFREWISSAMNSLLAQSAAMGALPTLYAATVPDILGGQYIGPDGFMEMRGYPAVVGSNEESYDLNVAKRLWEVSEQLTGVTYAFELVRA